MPGHGVGRMGTGTGTGQGVHSSSAGEGSVNGVGGLRRYQALPEVVLHFRSLLRRFEAMKL